MTIDAKPSQIQSNLLLACESAEFFQESEPLALDEDCVTRSGFHGKKQGCITRCVNGEEIQLYFELKGSGSQTILFVHDFATNSNVWDCTKEAFCKHFKVLTIDLRGHGRSSKPTSGYSLDTFAEDIHFVLRKLKIKNPTYVGWGLGGLIGQFYATRFPGCLHKLVLVGSTPAFANNLAQSWLFGLDSSLVQQLQAYLNNGQLDQFAQAFAGLVFFGDTCATEELKKTFVNILLSNDVKALAAVAQFLFSTTLVDNLDQIDLPTLIIAGNTDAVTPISASFFMNQHSKDSHVSLFCSGHLPFLINARGFNNTLRDFVKSCSIDTHCKIDCECDVCGLLTADLSHHCIQSKCKK